MTSFYSTTLIKLNLTSPDFASPSQLLGDDASYALWLTHFAEQLPLYAARYQVTEEEVIDIQHIAEKFAAMVANRPVDAAPQSWQVAKTFSLADSSCLFLLSRVSTIIQRIQSGPHYSLTDGYALGLATAPQLHGYHRLPLPKLRLAERQYTTEVPLLIWISRRDTTIELEVCRDSHTWHCLPTALPKQYADIHPQPAELTEWQYRARYRSPDWPSGRWCRIVKVLVGGKQPAS
ncbi:MAG: hypothetical protein ACRYFX_29510 [Janthinobacterium lividum]